jgi:hypothetical protein
MARCGAIKPNGERCQRSAEGQHGLCWAHDPTQAEARRRTASKGGKGKARGASEMAEVKREIRCVIEAVDAGETERGVGAVLFQGFNTLLKAVELERKVKEQEELEDRLEALEGVLKARRTG